MPKKLTQEEYIIKAKAAHGDRYDYSKVNYTSAREEVIIICPEHGEFEQTATAHINSSGCPKCGGSGKLTTSEFIERAISIHGDKYDYSKVIYLQAKSNVIIICPEHGEFKQTPSSHINGTCCGCPKCAGVRKLTTSEFIEKAKITHGDKYDYSKVVYSGNKDKITIICPEHGEFRQIPLSHRNGCGCPKCGNKIRSYKIVTNEVFIEKLKNKHGNLYDYSKVNYISNSTKIIIICPEHGEFTQKPHNHLRGDGCPKCNGGTKLSSSEYFSRVKMKHKNFYNYSKSIYKNTTSKMIINCPEHGDFEQRSANHLRGDGCPKCGKTMQLTTDDFIKQATSIHGDKYTYLKSNYINNRIKINITCPIHGEFMQQPNNHLSGKGCPKCGLEKFTFLSYNEAKIYVRNLGIKSSREYREWWKKTNPEFLPSNIETYYKYNN